MLTVLDYGAGNLASLAGALTREALPFRFADDASDAQSNDGPLVLPGVGHFRAAKEALVARGLWAVLKDAIAEGRPVVGICLGLQLLAEGSEEAPGEAGLGALHGVARKLPAEMEGVKVPHMGWNETIVRGLPSYVQFAPKWLYFVHSYALPESDETVLAAHHGIFFSAAASKGRVFGIQAHPERSGRDGQAFLASVLRGIAVPA